LTAGDGAGHPRRAGAELTARGLHAVLRTPPGRLPYLDVVNPRASVLTERVYAQADAFWYSWAQRIAGCDQVTTAPDMVARVLRTADGE